jgi:FtsP/CotA-like multicopper oxidase with cupredoxin domain
MLRYNMGVEVRWRVINLSFIPHSMHLHGMYFNVDAIGDIGTQQQLSEAQHRTVVTQRIGVGETFNMRWSADRPGNWLFHCHMTFHMHKPEHGASDHTHHHQPTKSAGMAGMVLGIEVSGGAISEPPPSQPAKIFSLILTEEPNRYGDKPGFRMTVEGIDAPRLNSGPVPGPVIVLTRGEPVEITVVNRLSKATAIHWHGIELDSFFDGVADWSGHGNRLAPPIHPGESFVAKFTPPRAGTFMYHTHWHDDAQLAGGLYGPLLVLEPGERYDPETDHVVVIGLNGVIQEDQWAVPSIVSLNGKTAPDPIVMRADVPNRLRLINITANAVSLWVLLHSVPFEQTTWKPIAKDGATLPSAQAQPRPARQIVAVGEIYDFEIVPSGARPLLPLWLELRRPDGGHLLQAVINPRR